MYAKAGLLSKSQQIFDRLSGRDIVTWSALIAGYTDHGFGQEALKQFQQMQFEGVAPNAVTFNCILRACGITHTLGKGQEIHSEIERQGLVKSNIVFGPTLIEMYSKCGSLEKAQDVFD
eukprot:c42092_g1_i1 orf=3-356(-)